jgi:hypothetical protein
MRLACACCNGVYVVPVEESPVHLLLFPNLPLSPSSPSVLTIVDARRGPTFNSRGFDRGGASKLGTTFHLDRTPYNN